MTDQIPTKVELKGWVDSRLYDIVRADALARNVPLSECVAQAVAKAYDCPDLAAVPRKRPGRPLGAKGRKKRGRK